MRRGVSPLQFLAGMVLKAVLDRLGVRGRQVPAAAPPVRSPERAAPAVRRGPLLLFMFAMLGIGLLLMLVFEAWVTRFLGVTALFAFIVSGVFLIADPAFLAAADDER
jgi:hypothetical protein